MEELFMNYAKIAKNKSLLKEYVNNDIRTVYLKDGDEYQIELFNPTQQEIGAKIYIDNTPLSNKIIIYPGQRIWLERYTDKKNKFKFVTYNVDNTIETQKAIEHNGEIKIEFYSKKIESYCYYNSISTISPSITWTNTSATSTSPITSTYSYSETNYADGTSCTSASLNGETLSLDNKETGRTTAGSKSNQELTSTSIDLEYFPFRIETIKILPESSRPLDSKDLNKIYCTQCGHKLKTKYKYCPYCGTKID